jgi:hypothetical protein
VRIQQLVFYLTVSAVLIHFLSDGTMPKLINQAAAFSVTASRSLQPVARSI